MGMKALAAALLVAATTTAFPGGALACTIARPNPPPTEAQIDAWTLRRYAQAGAALEVEVVRGSNGAEPGEMRVIRVFKGDIAPGAPISVRAMSSAMCGAGDFAQGSRGYVLGPARGPVYFEGYLLPSQVTLLRRHGLLGPGRR